MRKGKEDLEKESNNLAIIVVLALFLICSLGYIAYDKYFINILGPAEETKKEEKKEEVEKTTYNKDGYFIQNLMNDIYYKSYIDHNEYELFINDKTTVEDFPKYYRDTLLMRKVSKEVFTTEELDKASVELFGKKVFDNYPDKISGACQTFNLSERTSTYMKDQQSGGCGGAGYRYYDKITKVESDDTAIYVFMKVGFPCDEGVCKTVEKDGDSYNTKDVIKELDNYTDSVNMDDILKDLNEYKFTFKYDSRNNIYYFDSAELVK